MNERRMEGATAIITGAARDGIGRASAIALANDGAEVVLVDIQGLEDSMAAVREAGGTGKAYRVNVVDEAAVRDFYAQVKTDHPPVRALVNAAGIHREKDVPWRNLTEAIFDETMKVNTWGAVLMSQGVVPLMIAHGQGGAIVHISSLAARFGGRSVGAAYSMSKGALSVFSKIIAVQEGKSKIRSNSICPSPVNTDMIKEFAEAVVERMIAATPLGRIIQPQEVAEVVLHYATDRSGMTTGTTYDLNGGQYIAP